MKRERRKLTLNRETLQRVVGSVTVIGTLACTNTCHSCFLRCDPAWTMSCPSPRPCTFSLPPCPI
jgi:hypothetical protein